MKTTEGQGSYRKSGSNDSVDSSIVEKSRKRKLISESEIKPEKLANVLDNNISNPKHDWWQSENKNSNLNVIVSNLPICWSFDQFNTYFTELFSFKEFELEISDSFDGTVKLIFHDAEKLKKAINKLQDSVADGRKLCFETEGEIPNIGSEKTDIIPEKSESVTPQSNKTESNNELDATEISCMESSIIDPSGLYGLKPAFLASLRIKPPIDNWVHITNFRCDEQQLRNVMELAGHIVILSVYLTPKYAKVMYSHPLEAVQAVSMLNGQTYYGDVLKIIMIPNPGDIVTLPKGLTGVGPGLGNDGKPLREIEKHFNRLLSKKPTALNMKYFRALDENQKFEPLPAECPKSKTIENKIIQQSTSKSILKKSNSETVRKESDAVPKKDAKPDAIPENDAKPKNTAKPDATSKNRSLNDDENNTNDSQHSKQLSYTFDSDSEKSVSSPETDSNKSKTSFDSNQGPDPKSRSSSNCFGTFKANSIINNVKPIETIRVRQNLFMPKSGPNWTPNMPAISQPTRFGPGQMSIQGPGGPRFSNPGFGNNGGPMSNPMGMQGPIRAMGPGHNTFGPVGSIPPRFSGPSGPVGPCGPMGQSGPMAQSGPMGQSGPMRPPMIQSGPMGPPMVQSGPIAPMGPHSNMAGPMTGGSNLMSEPVMLELKNLPLSTTMPFLCQKFSEIGQVVSLQLTTPGCALVRFANLQQAQMCYLMQSGFTKPMQMEI